MNGFDVLVLIIVAVSALLAFARGFVREFLSMTALALAVLAVLWGLPIFREPVQNALNTKAWIANTITVVAIFLLVYVAIRVFTGRIHEWVHDSEPLGIIDRTAGVLFGVARGFVIIAICVITFISVAKPDKWPKFLKEAQFFPFLVITGDALKSLAPEATQAAIDTAVKASQNGKEIAAKRDQDRDDTEVADNENNFKDLTKNDKESDIVKGREDKSKIPDFIFNEDKKSDKNNAVSSSKDTPKLKVEPK